MYREQPNLSMIQEISSDEDFQKNVLEIIKKEFLEEVQLFEKQYQNQQFTEAAKQVHKIKHKVGLLALKEGEKITSTFEKQLIEGNTKLHAQFLEVLYKIHVYLY